MNISYKRIRRVTITGRMEDGRKAYDWAYKNGYSVKVSGPMLVGNFTSDPDRFKIIAEKEIK